MLSDFRSLNLSRPIYSHEHEICKFLIYNEDEIQKDLLMKTRLGAIHH